MTEQPHHLDNPLYRLLRDEDIKGFNAQKPAEGQIDLAHGDFRGLDLRLLNAERIDFTGAYFRGADLRGIDRGVPFQLGFHVLLELRIGFHV